MASEWGSKRGLPKVCPGPAGGVWTGQFWVGLLDPEECVQPLEPGMDDHQWLYQANLEFADFISQ